jgi:hypothetical protein
MMGTIKAILNIYGQICSTAICCQVVINSEPFENDLQDQDITTTIAAPQNGGTTGFAPASSLTHDAAALGGHSIEANLKMMNDPVDEPHIASAEEPDLPKQVQQ